MPVLLWEKCERMQWRGTRMNFWCLDEILQNSKFKLCFILRSFADICWEGKIKRGQWNCWHDQQLPGQLWMRVDDLYWIKFNFFFWTFLQDIPVNDYDCCGLISFSFQYSRKSRNQMLSKNCYYLESIFLQ